VDSQSKIKKIGDAYILYDASLIADPAVQLFDADYHIKQHRQQKNSGSTNLASTNSAATLHSGIGRARVVYFPFANKTLVLKHYYRGGAVAAISKDRYLGLSIVKSRSFREWRLLKKMLELGLPVPVAVAAQVKKSLFYYRADLITEKIENSKTLADVLMESALSTAQWKSIGACIKLFHQQDIYHADLNARNILLTLTGEVYLIDFDNSGFRTANDSWKQANLARLKRSLLKFKNNSACHFEQADWQCLLEGYKQ